MGFLVLLMSNRGFGALRLEGAVLLAQLLIALLVLRRPFPEFHGFLAVAPAGDDLALPGDAVARDRHVIVGLDVHAQLDRLASLWVLLLGELKSQLFSILDEGGIFRHCR